MAVAKIDLSPSEIGKIIGFQGYGNLEAPVWFIGKEEGLGDMKSDDIVHNLKKRTGFSSTMDLYTAHHQCLKEKGALIDFPKKKKFTPVWVWIAKFMRGCSAASDWKESDPAKEYISSKAWEGRGPNLPDQTVADSCRKRLDSKGVQITFREARYRA